MKIGASILKVENISSAISKLEKTNIDYLHLDVVDGKFADNRKEYDNVTTTKLLDVHLMVEDVKSYVDKYSHLNPKYITFHIEVGNTQEYINYIKQKHIKVGIALARDTELFAVIPYLDQIDLVLVLSIVPGTGGQNFSDNAISKIDKLYSWKDKYNYVIEVDGGINDETISKVEKCDMAVVGSYITDNDDYQKQIDILKSKMN